MKNLIVVSLLAASTLTNAFAQGENESPAFKGSPDLFDTYVKKTNGHTAHFDIIVPHGSHGIEEVLSFGERYLRNIGESDEGLSSRECQFCHIEDPPAGIIEHTNRQGYYILEMEDIPAELPANPNRSQLILHLRAISEAHRFVDFRGWAKEKIQDLIEIAGNRKAPGLVKTNK